MRVCRDDLVQLVESDWHDIVKDCPTYKEGCRRVKRITGIEMTKARWYYLKSAMRAKYPQPAAKEKALSIQDKIALLKRTTEELAKTLGVELPREFRSI